MARIPIEGFMCQRCAHPPRTQHLPQMQKPLLEQSPASWPLARNDAPQTARRVLSLCRPAPVTTPTTRRRGPRIINRCDLARTGLSEITAALTTLDAIGMAEVFECPPARPNARQLSTAELELAT